jgi:uncharacterized protein (DUF2384 family)
MAASDDYETVERKARSLFGNYADHWLFKPNRSLAQLTPYELAQSPPGARLVLWELGRTVLTDTADQEA